MIAIFDLQVLRSTWHETGLSLVETGSIMAAGLDSLVFGTHSMRRTKAAQIYRKTGNLRAVQLLLGHTKLESTVRYLGIEVDDALSIVLIVGFGSDLVGARYARGDL
jgi:integrase